MKDPLKIIADEYCKQAKQYCYHFEENKKSNIKITYTAMHGVGAEWVKRVFKEFGLNDYISVKEQNDPDPDFPTVTYPNPEEGKGSLKLAIETAEKHESKLILANDPDADRLAVAERQDDGNWKIFNGNEIAFLLADWMFKHYKGDKKKVAMVSSTVSSKILKAMAEQEGFYWDETLTGFKWIGNRCAELEKEGYNVLLGFEVEIGNIF